MQVYLTFDDGIEAGTEEILNVLHEMNVPATFFLVGSNVEWAYNENQNKCLELLKKIYQNHSIGNHSFSHAYYKYSDFYENDGLGFLNRRYHGSVSKDFDKCSNILNQYIQLFAERRPKTLYPLAKHQNIPLARLPGRNTWLISKAGQFSLRNSSESFCYFDNDTQKYARQLFDKGYNIFGWNTEWKMSFDLHRQIVSLVNEDVLKADEGLKTNLPISPRLNICSYNHINKDRLTETWLDVLKKVLKNNMFNKVVLLIHDRAFRKCSFPILQKGNLEYENQDAIVKNDPIEQLRCFILAARSLNMEFKTLDRFFD